ncbi:hypothetical protein C5B42_04430 [Candidatus Cerribacteria bacterium 'Amazon FNV 2010 28 9']|uniref:Uncharacterized protein n=1 Tax=Candidatus Cerribacteria bacterium 'Amazon FNV 2010 28 9' TaxID=2081795 RepID=A0A317JPF8_9BACT|nr:MAG: hypothetical protein C5B42_04430 [Candidatus Cerribacteria bacterium 'Amazon FNV 2010 28 9']
MKTCGKCGKQFLEIPENARFFKGKTSDVLDGYYWNCECGSTLFSKIERDFIFDFVVNADTCRDCGEEFELKIFEHGKLLDVIHGDNKLVQGYFRFYGGRN